MNWQAFVTAQAATLDQYGRVVFEPNAGASAGLSEPTIAMPLSHYSVMTISGPDSLTFLQGQLTCDMRALSAEQGLAGALCTPKGRMVSNFYLQQAARDAIMFLLPTATLAATKATLAKYIVFSKAQIQDGQQRCLLGVAGARAADLIQRRFGAVPDKRFGLVSVEHAAALCISPGQKRYLLSVRPSDLESQWQQLTKDATPVDSNVWDILDIRAGFGFVQEHTEEMFIPQMLNLQVTEGVSFTKGCYTGQEIVSRTQYRGNLKRRMYRASCSTDAAPGPGAAIYSSLKEQPVGTVVMAESGAANCVELLAVLALGGAEEVLSIGDKQGPRLELQELPYALPQ